MLAQAGGFPSPFANLANQLQGSPFQYLVSLQQHLNSIAQQSSMPSQSPSHSGYSTPSLPSRKPRMGGTTVKTAKVWKYFDQLPAEEQAAECQLCRKKIKATNSSTTGMIRHLRSCHVNEYQQLQEARQSALIIKMEMQEEKARGGKGEGIPSTHNATTAAHSPNTPSHKTGCAPLSPHSASDSGVSEGSSASGVAGPSSPHSIIGLLHDLPAGLPAPKPVLPTNGHTVVKMEVDEEKEGEDVVQDLSLRPAGSLPRKNIVDLIEERRVNTQVALMLLLDSCPSSIVDRPGFRGLIKMLLPSHTLPCASQFDSVIIPDVISRLKADLSTPFAANNPCEGATAPSSLPPPSSLPNWDKEQKSPANGGKGGEEPEQVRAAMRAASNISRSFTHSLELRREEDSDSSSSADSETAMPARIDSFLNFIGRYVFPHEDVISLLTICRAWFAHFEEAGELQVLLAGLTLPVRVPGKPELARDVAFVALNVQRLNAYILLHPEVVLSPITDSQAQFIKDLHAHICAL